MAELVSILIPCFNAEKWLKETIESALSQTWPNKEIIIVDDGSTDNSLQIARLYESTIVKVISQENRGGCTARNRALEYARGDYIQWLDADDILAPDKIERQINGANRLRNTRILLSGPWAEFYYRRSTAKFVKSNLWQDLDPIQWFVVKFSDQVYMTNNTWLVSRKLTEQAGPWDERLSRDQDGEYFGRLVAACERVVFVPDALSYYRRTSPKSVSGNLSEKAKESEFLSKTLCINYLRSLEESESTRKACLLFLQNGFDYHHMKQVSIVQRARSLAKELGGELASLAPKSRLRFARAVLGKSLAEKTRRLAWVLKVLIKANWDKLLYDLSKK
jgi:glycosyltransferase involved in cell wall biosynthesis